MANYACTDYHVCGWRENVERLFKELQRVITTDRSSEKDHSTYLPDASWLGYVVSDILDLDYEKDNVPCRGVIEYMDEQVYVDKEGSVSFSLMTETAWIDCRKLFYLLSETFEVDIYFIVEELGCGILESNDEDGSIFGTRYKLDNFDGEGISEYSSFDELADKIHHITGERPAAFDAIEELFAKYDIEEGYSVYEVDTVSLSDF